jgi:hypothetical protein
VWALKVVGHFPRVKRLNLLRLWDRQARFFRAFWQAARFNDGCREKQNYPETAVLDGNFFTNPYVLFLDYPKTGLL